MYFNYWMAFSIISERQPKTMYVHGGIRYCLYHSSDTAVLAIDNKSVKMSHPSNSHGVSPLTPPGPANTRTGTQYALDSDKFYGQHGRP